MCEYKEPRVNSLVTLTDDAKGWGGYADLKGEGVLIYLGEIINMPGHGIFLGHKTKRIWSGLHIDNFRELTDDEI